MITMTSIKNLRLAPNSSGGKSSVERYEVMSTTPMFTKLLVIRITASNSFGLSSNFNAVVAALPGRSDKFSLSVGEREKNAASEPDISADIHKSRTTEMAQTITGAMTTSH